jgi:hypothetical protein
MGYVLDRDAFRHYVDGFAENDEELIVRHTDAGCTHPPYPPDVCYPLDNRAAWPWLRENIPFFECPDKGFEEIYYFRWWTYRKHIKQTADGFVVTEFLPPVPWAGKHNTISCAAGHHFYEGRWLRDPQYLDDYAVFWFRKGGDPRRYSFWAADALYQRYLVTGDERLILDLLPDLVENYRAWEQGWEGADHVWPGETRRGPNGLFWQFDGLDGMEISVGGHGYRPTINAYMYGDAVAIARIASGERALAEAFRERAQEIKRLVQECLWDPDAAFFKTLPRGDGQHLVDVRELHGYTPWYVNLPDGGFEGAWAQLMDPAGFWSPYGPTTAEQRHPGFAISYDGHECQWNGPSWPYATSVTLTALANLLVNYEQAVVSREEYFEVLKTYTKCHRRTREDGQIVPWIDENLNPYTGDWIARTRLKTWKDGTWDPAKGGRERGKDYNHSTYCDLIISGLVGLRPQADDRVVVHPLLPEGTWDYFCLDHVSYHGQTLTVLYDRTGKRYNLGRGLRVYADGREVAASERLERVTGQLTES